MRKIGRGAGWLVLAVGMASAVACGEEAASVTIGGGDPATVGDSSTMGAHDGGATTERDGGATMDATTAAMDGATRDAMKDPTPDGTESPTGDAMVDSTPGMMDGGTLPLDGSVAAPDAGAIEVDAAGLIATVELPAPELSDGPEVTGQCEVMVDDEDCDESKRPIVFIHGTVANADSFAHPAKLFASNGYCADRIRGIEYHSLIGKAGTATFELDWEATYQAAKRAVDAEIAALQEEFGVAQVDLAGHSQGGAHGQRYARENADKVAHYINLAAGAPTMDPGGVPTLNLSSVGDRPVEAGTTKNVVFQDRWLDHSAVASSTEAFVEMYKFLNDGAEPMYTTVQCGRPIMLEGKAQTFADNQPLPGAKVEIYELGNSPTSRGAPVASYTLGADAKFGPFEAKPGVAYEFKMVPPEGDTRRPGHAYLPPFVRSDRLLRFNFETKDPVAGATSNRVNRDPSIAVIIPRSRQKAFLAERDSLTIDGVEVISRANTLTVPPTTGMVRSAVTVAYYLFDASLTPGSYGPGDEMSSGESVVSGSFVNSADIYIPTVPPKFIEVTFNGRTLRVPNWPSTSEGNSIVIVN